jgi:hypothetical protein
MQPPGFRATKRPDHLSIVFCAAFNVKHEAARQNRTQRARRGNRTLAILADTFIRDDLSDLCKPIFDPKKREKGGLTRSNPLRPPPSL